MGMHFGSEDDWPSDPPMTDAEIDARDLKQNPPDPTLEDFLLERKKSEILKVRLGFSLDPIMVGDKCLVSMPDGVYYCTKTSHNYYQSGRLNIPVDCQTITDTIGIKDFPNLKGME